MQSENKNGKNMKQDAKMKIDRISQHSYAAAAQDGKVYILSNRPVTMSDSVFMNMSGTDWDDYPQQVGDYRIVPYGADNLFPAHIREVLGGNNLVPGIIERQIGLLYGQGVYLSRMMFDGGQISRQWIEDKEIRSWLDSWDYVSYIKGCITDYLHLKGFFDAKYMAKGHRIGMPGRIACLEHIPANNARLEWTDTRRLKDVKRIIVGDFDHWCTTTGAKAYPVYDRNNPGRYPVSASYNSTYSFARDFYSVPQYWGAFRWIIRGSEIPLIFKYVTDNGLNLAYHIHSTAQYWDYRRNILKIAHPDWDEARVEKEIAGITQKILHSMTEVLTGKENAGKFLHTIDLTDDMGNRQEWRIEAIDQKIKDLWTPS